MSGEIFHQMENLPNMDFSKRNPLLCYLCNAQYNEPCILSCFHSFCAQCLRGRATDGKMICPLCSSVSVLKDGASTPAQDRLLNFLVESSSEEKAQCANCEEHGSNMFFCNTCSQPLCQTCRTETHKAKMFSRHEISLLSKRTKDIHKKCFIHDEPYIMFSTEKKLMLCINCFRDMKVESRSHCVDLETAYKQGCKKLDHTVQAIRDLQSSVRDGIVLFKSLLQEIQQNSEAEKESVNSTFVKLQSRIVEKKDMLLCEVDRQYEEKEKLFQEQLKSLCTLLPTLHVHLVTCSAFTSSANRFEFLDLAYLLMERLKSITRLNHPLHPTQGSQIITDYKHQFAKCLEPLVSFHRNSDSISSNSSLSLSRSSGVLTPPPGLRLEIATTVSSGGHSSNSNVYTVAHHSMRRGNKVKFIDSKGTFADHCKEFDPTHRELMAFLEKLKSRGQELQRDLTLRRCIAQTNGITELQEKAEELEEKLSKHYTALEQQRPVLDKHWEESLQRLANEQELYQMQLHDVMRMQQENKVLNTIVTQLGPFATSISAVAERISPKLSKSTKTSGSDSQLHALFEEINTIQPDSQHRVDAIQAAHDERQTEQANRTNPLDEELIKTKGTLKPPCARKESFGKKDRELRESKVVSAINEGTEQVKQAQEACDLSDGMSNHTEITEICEPFVDSAGVGDSKQCNGLDLNSAVSQCNSNDVTEQTESEELVSKVSESNEKSCTSSIVSDSEEDSSQAAGLLKKLKRNSGVCDIVEDFEKQIGIGATDNLDIKDGAASASTEGYVIKKDNLSVPVEGSAKNQNT